MRWLNYLRVVTCLSILFILFSRPSTAKACSCVEGVTAIDEFKQNDAVFTGKAIRIVDNYTPIFSMLDSIMYKLGFSPYFFFAGVKRSGFSIIFKVIDSWKGVENASTEIVTGRGEGDCGYSFMPDKEYLVYASHAYGKPDNYWVTGICERNSELSKVTDDFIYLKTLSTISLKSTLPILLTEKDIILYGLPGTIIGVIFLIRQWSRKKKIQFEIK